MLVLVLETVGALTRRFLPTAWRGAALACGRRPRDISLRRPIRPKNVATGGSRE
jgi:hypothetical protein